MDTKSYLIAEVKAVDNANDPPGTFEALVAVFGNVDRGGDRLMPGAFKRTLGKNGRGLPPILWSHNWDEPPIGVTLDAQETDKGLLLKGQLFIEENDLARKVHTAMLAKDGRGQSPLREFSFGYEVVKAKDVTEEGVTVRELQDVILYEASPTLVGMNPATQLVGVKTAGESDTLDAELEDSTTNAPSAEESSRIGRLLTDRPSVI